MDNVVEIVALAQLAALEHHLVNSPRPGFAAWVRDVTAFGRSRCE